MDTHNLSNDGPPRSQSSAQVALLPHQIELVRELEFRPEDVWWERKPGQWEINPLLLAKIAERVQFDGDFPELRFGNLPEGGRPAVPVLTETTNPVLLGVMLQRVSTQVLEELDAARKSWEDSVGSNEAALMEQLQTMPVFSAPGYQAGQVPVPRQVEVSVSELDAMSLSDQQLAAFMAIATSQGRVSSLPHITQTLLEELLAKGYEVRLGREGIHHLSQATWTMEISHVEEINPRFSPVAAAKTSLLRDILQQIPTDAKSMVLVVRPIHAVHERKVGWKVDLYGG